MNTAKRPDLVTQRPSFDTFKNHKTLVALCDCWADARGDKMLPSKRDFEGKTLDFPEFLPNMTLVELSPDGEFQFVYVGSEIVARRNTEQTGLSIENMFDPKAGKLLLDWAFAQIEIPHINFYKTQTHLQSGAISETANLSVVLSNNQGQPSRIAAVTVVGEAFGQESQRGGFLIGSAGLEINSIDIGFGIPDLPKTVAFSTFS